ncbi:MAG TPA: hypothetical protein VNH84_10690 [Candidatus Saccharimonadales bacterium]|nr:hypothetical protein [Candidatus Saccharimonadales bacterium]
MLYAILQKELVLPEVEKLRRAFSVSPLLTKLDAQTAFNDAYGILLRGQEEEHAKLIQAALQEEKVETELVEEAKLPALPVARIARQMAYEPEHLILTDPMQRQARAAWSDILLIAAGYVKLREVRRHRSALEESPTHAAGIGEDMRSDSTAREEEHPHMLLELFLHGGTRYSLQADEFSFEHLGARQTDDLSLDFVAVVRDVAERAPQAGQNRGAYHACLEPPELFPYPSKAAYQEELLWMLWRIERLRRGA